MSEALTWRMFNHNSSQKELIFGSNEVTGTMLAGPAYPTGSVDWLSTAARERVAVSGAPSPAAGANPALPRWYAGRWWRDHLRRSRTPAETGPRREHQSCSAEGSCREESSQVAPNPTSSLAGLRDRTCLREQLQGPARPSSSG